MSKRTRPPRRTCKVIGFKAFHDTDADILDWWESIEEGARSGILRDLIREHLTGQQVRTRSKTKPPAGSLPFADLERVRDDTTWIREALNDMPAYLERIIQQAVVLQPVARSPAEAVAIQDDPALTVQDTTRREARMRRTLW